MPNQMCELPSHRWRTPPQCLCFRREVAWSTLDHSSRACKALPKQRNNGILCRMTNSTCTLVRGAKARSDAGLVLVESLWKPNQRPYHKQKLAFLLTSMRHFALEAAKAGHPVVYLAGPETYAEALEEFAGKHGPLTFMRPAERELRCHLSPLVQAGTLVEHPHEGLAYDTRRLSHIDPG